jgi:hypothetical protein
MLKELKNGRSRVNILERIFKIASAKDIGVTAIGN